jgi:hypothetical protein
MITLYQIRLPHATFGIEVRDGIVTRAAPIAKWTVGKKSGDVLGYYMRRYYPSEAWAVTGIREEGEESVRSSNGNASVSASAVDDHSLCINKPASNRCRIDCTYGAHGQGNGANR